MPQSKLKIRRARPENATGIIASHRRSIRELCAKDYNPAQIAAWSGRDFQETRWHQTMSKDFVWVIANDREDIFGFGHLQFLEDKPEANLVGLYFVPEAKGLGFGRELFDLMKNECLAKHVKVVSLTSTKTSKSFYEKMGFSQQGDISQVKMGDQILDVYKMRATLEAIS